MQEGLDRDRGLLRPALTAAVGYALQARHPATSYFCRPLCSRLEGCRADVGSAVLLLLEPWTAGRSVLHVLGRLLESQRDCGQLLSTARWFLGRLGEAQDPQRFARRFLQGGHEGGGNQGGVAEADDLLREVLDRVSALPRA